MWYQNSQIETGGFNIVNVKIWKIFGLLQNELRHMTEFFLYYLGYV